MALNNLNPNSASNGGINNPAVSNGTPSVRPAPRGGAPKSRRATTGNANGSSSNISNSNGNNQHNPVPAVAIPVVVTPVASVPDAPAPNPNSSDSDVLLAKPSASQNDSLHWWSPRLPVDGALGTEWKAHEERLPGLLKIYPMRAWDMVQQWMMARVAGESAQATERAAQDEVQERKRGNAARRGDLDHGMAAIRTDATATQKAILEGRRTLAIQAGNADLILSDPATLTLPGAAAALEAALARRIPSDAVLAGDYHWVPGGGLSWLGEPKTTLHQVAALGKVAVDVLVALAFGMLSGLTLGVLSGLIRPADLRAPEEIWPKLLVAWAVGTFIEAKAAHAARDAAILSSYGWNARQDSARAASDDAPVDKLPSIDGGRGDILSVAVAGWLFGGLTLVHGMGIHHIATHASGHLRFSQGGAASGGAASNAALEFPLWLFFAAGGVATAAYMGSHALSALKEARAAQRAVALQSLRWHHRRQLLDDPHVHAAVVAANSLDVLAQHALDLEARYEALGAQWNKSFEMPLSQTTLDALRATDDEARGERLRAQESIRKLIEMLEPMPDAKSARKNFQRQQPPASSLHIPAA